MTQPMSLEEFAENALNFSHHFVNQEGMDNHLRNSEYFKAFQRECPSLDISLTDVITAIWYAAEDHTAQRDRGQSGSELKQIEEAYKRRNIQDRTNLILLYAAYKCMRNHVPDEEVLFR